MIDVTKTTAVEMIIDSLGFFTGRPSQTLQETVEYWLENNEFDGLTDDQGCGCGGDDFADCGDDGWLLCTPAYAFSDGKYPCYWTPESVYHAVTAFCVVAGIWRVGL